MFIPPDLSLTRRCSEADGRATVTVCKGTCSEKTEVAAQKESV